MNVRVKPGSASLAAVAAAVAIAASTLAACKKEAPAPSTPPASAAPAPAPKDDVPAAVAAGARPTTPPPAAAAGPAGPTAESENYLVKAESAGAAVGQPAVATITVNATGGYHLNEEFPTAVEIVAPGGVTLPTAKFDKAAAKTWTPKLATWEIPFTAAAAGEQKFTATAKFAVCTDTTCDPKRVDLAWTVAVK